MENLKKKKNESIVKKKNKNSPRISDDSYFVKLSTVVSNGKHEEQS